MAVSWTEDQKQAIDRTDSNILVNAAAGSGKTAVLVERILRIVTDPIRPVDVDRLLVVTFTRAAAAEMKDRIGKALEARLQKEPENEHLQKQGILLHHAQISTIHGFCTYVIQNYFHRINLDPGYRIAEDSELTMMKREVLGEILEAEYAKEEAAFLGFIEAFAPGKNDRAAEELVLRLYEFSVSDPDPEGWLENCLQVYRIRSEEELSASSWLLDGVREGRELLKDAAERIRETLELAMEEGGPWEYIPQIEADLKIAEDLLAGESYEELVKGFRSRKHPALSRKKMPGVNEQLKEQVKSNRDRYKDALAKIGEQYFSLPAAVILEELKNCRLHAEELVRLTRLFAAGFAARKRKQNVLDFSDLEHFALDILLEREAVTPGTEDGTASSGVRWKRSSAAAELSRQYYEIMIDEYQDSNFVQEALLRAVSGEEEGRFNRFMVGDIKQSIYGFRQAKPELFLEKYQSYREADNCSRIDLKQNFRSRRQVLQTANVLFQRLMIPALGGIEYDEAAALHPGFAYPETPSGDCNTEIILLDKKDPEMEELTLKEDLVEMEALTVAARIRELMKNQQVYDRKTEQFRPAQYRDFAILLRSFKGKAEVFLRVLKSEGIPSFAVSKTGYFSTIEVSTAVNYLRILDNPRQDIPYAAVLRSPIVNLTDEELAMLRCAGQEQALYEIVPRLTEQYRQFHPGSGELPKGIPAELLKKLVQFHEQLESFRDRVPCFPVHELLTAVLDETGYRNLAGSLPMGEQRLANLNLLAEKAVDFEAAGYHGLFQFLRYLDQMEKNRIDFGEVNLYGETADAVGIMTIHKSKGLEYPFVFVSCLGSRFSTMDTKASVIFHSGLGLGLNYVDPEKRVRHSTMIKRLVAQRIHLEMLAEELRVLYVALTRAKEKLILTAVVDNLEKRVVSCGQIPSLRDRALPYGILTGASSYLDWILPVAAGTEGFRSVYELFLGEQHPKACIDAPVSVRVQTPAAMTQDKIRETVERSVLAEELRRVGEEPETVYEEEIRQFLRKKMDWSYPWNYRKELPSVMSVSELKKKRPSQSEEERYAAEPGLTAEQIAVLAWGTGEDSEEDVYLPAFMRETETVRTGALRGTAYHRFFECVDYSRLPEKEDDLLSFVQEQLLEMVQAGKMEQLEAECLKLSDFADFLKSNLGRRMRRAAGQGRLLREKSFLMELPADELDPAWSKSEKILIRGVIDACFLEDGEYVLVDYKTDKVYSQDGSCLVHRYAKQLQFYQKALEKGSGLPVKERIIYSVTLGKELPVPAENECLKQNAASRE